MYRIAIDGACRRNGKPDCVSAGGIFVQIFSDDGRLVQCSTASTYECNSTNQRGEMHALLLALKVARRCGAPTCIITDSEYLLNTMSKNWIANWQRKGWVTAAEAPVKNRDLWEQIAVEAEACKDVSYYYIKGHCMPFGKVTAAQLLATDATAGLLMLKVFEKYCDLQQTVDLERAATELSIKNNGFPLDAELLRDFVVANTVADAVATQCVNMADALISSGSPQS